TQQRELLGKFYYRPPGGESWADVALRLRAVLTEIRLTMPGERVLLVTHDVVVLLARYILEELSTDEALALSGQVANCSITSYEHRGGTLQLQAFNQPTGGQDRAGSRTLTD